MSVSIKLVSWYNEMVILGNRIPYKSTALIKTSTSTTGFECFSLLILKNVVGLNWL